MRLPPTFKFFRRILGSRQCTRPSPDATVSCLVTGRSASRCAQEAARAPIKSREAWTAFHSYTLQPSRTMNALWLYRVFTFVLACILSIVVVALCAGTSSNLDEILPLIRRDQDNFPYAHLGIAVGVMTLVSYSVMMGLDLLFERVFTSFMVVEMVWTSILWVLWIAVGGTTFSEGNTLFEGKPCSMFDVVLPKAKDVCDDIQPIGSVAFVTFALLFVYTGVLLFVAFTSSNSTPPWTTSVKNRSK
ncbi:hypothetical protein OH77DRAFT_526177 [Trametes cingulata]|nr:hypothetical protein OH77DRAFT_526177 [Trametes cingulata]